MGQSVRAKELPHRQMHKLTIPKSELVVEADNVISLEIPATVDKLSDVVETDAVSVPVITVLEETVIRFVERRLQFVSLPKH
jgi:hypothetical protein